MNNFKLVVMGVVPVILFALFVNQILEISKEFHRDTPEYQISQEHLQEVVRVVEQAQNVKYEPIDSIFEPREQFPFGTFRRPRRRGTPTPRYERATLRLQGVLQSETPMAVFVDPSGATHFLKVGESLLDREIRSITTAGVTVRDQAGTEILTVD